MESTAVVLRRDEQTQLDVASDGGGPDDEDAETRAKREKEDREREEQLVELVSTATYRQFYRKKARGKHLVTGAVFDILQFAFLAAAREAARRGSGVIISAGQGAIERAKERLGVDASSETLTTYTGHWNYLFEGYEEAGILSDVVKTNNGAFRVRFFMRGDKAVRLFWLSIEDDEGNVILRTRPDAVRVRLGESADKLLVQQVIESHTALTEIKSWLRANRRPIGLALVTVLMILFVRDDTRAAMFRGARKIEEAVKEGIRIITGAPKPPAPVSEQPEATPPLRIESAPPTPPFDPSSTVSTHEATADVVLPPGVWLDVFKPQAPAPLPGGYAPSIELNPASVENAYFDMVERDPDSGVRRLLDRRAEQKDYPERENFGMNVVSSGAPFSTLSRLSFNSRITGPEWTMRPPKYIKWAIYRVSPSGELLPPAMTGLGRQIFAEVDSRESYAVLMEAETEISRDGTVYTQMGLAKLQFDRGKWKLSFPGATIDYDRVHFGKPFKRQVVAGQRWNEPLKGRFSFLVFPGKMDRTSRELLINFGDGATTDRDYECGNVEPPEDTDADWSEHVYTCNAVHTFKTPGPKTVTVKLLNKTIGTHPNHPVVEEFSTTVNVTDVK